MKKIVLTMLAFTLTVILTLGLASCSGSVKFDLNFVVDKEVYASISTSGNEAIELPENPNKDGYTFVGWYWDEDLWQKPFTANSLLDAPLSSDMSVYAKFNCNHTSVGDWITDSEATCKVAGAKHKECAVCGTTVESITIEKLATHTPSDWKIDKEATCKEEGAKHKECTVCGDVVEESTIDKTQNHTVVIDKSVEPTELTDGLTEGSHCSFCGKVLVAQEVIPAKLQGTNIRSNVMSVSGDNISASVSNAIETFSFLNDITVADSASYIVARDISCQDVIASKTVALESGNNRFYIFVTNGNDAKLYTVTVRRLPMYTVSFNTKGGSAVATQTIEEGSLATVPTTERAGYTFVSWSYDFAIPITSNITVNANWQANTDTKYRVEYYLENLQDSGYTILESETENLTGTTDTTANAEQKTFEHFALNTLKSELSGNISGDGSLVLKVYYTRSSYTVTTDRNNTKGGTVTSGGTYAYDKSITLTASTNVGYTFLGWFEGETKVCTGLSYTFNVDHTATYTAKWSANTATSYKVEYYLENVGKNGYEAPIIVNLIGTTDTTANAEQKTFEHFTLNTSKSKLSGNINGDGSLVLKVYYTRNTYTISNANKDYGSITKTGSYAYGSKIEVTATPTKLGYEFIGWYSGNELLSSSDTYTFTVDKNVEARFAVKSEMSNFEFASTATTCEITGIKDKSATEITIPDYVTSIGSSAFEGCTIEYANIPTIVISAIPKSSLETVVINSGNSIGDHAFEDCTSLTSVTIGNSVESIGNSAFEGCTSLASVTIGDSVTSISSCAFYSCTSLKSVTIGNSVESIGNSAFYGCNSLNYKEYDDAYYLGNEDNPYLVLVEAKSKDITSCTIHEKTKIVCYSAFLDCDNLKTVTIPNSVTTIGNSAFFSCTSLKSVTIGNSVTSIGSSAFQLCDLTSITVSEENGFYKSIDGNLYSKDGKTLIKYAIGKSNTRFDIPNSVTSIGDYAFNYCDNLTSVTIPDTVISIGVSAFYGCENLANIKYRGSKEQWRYIEKGYAWDCCYAWGTTVQINYTMTYNYTGN